MSEKDLTAMLQQAHMTSEVNSALLGSISPIDLEEDWKPLLCTEPEGTAPLCYIAIKENRLEVNEATLSIIQTAFKTCESLSSLVILGHPQSGKSALLDAILASGAHFTDLPDEEGLYIWPNPVQAGCQSLLLMEMSGIYFVSPSEATLKLAAISQALSAVCGICLEKASFFDNLNSLLGLWDFQAAQFPQKFLVFTNSEPQGKVRRNSRYLECRNKYPSNCLFLERDSKLPSNQLIRSILDETITCSKDFPEIAVPENTIIEKFAHFTHLSVQIANMTSTALNFVSEFDSLKQFAPSQWSKMEKERDRVQSAESLELFFCSDRDIYVRNSTVAVLQRNFHLERDVVVLAVLGDPGVGKSTLLNCVIQHTASLSPLHTVFQPSRDSTEKCKALSCPILLGPARDLQCMLLDVEGLGCMETPREGVQLRHERTETGVLALASVVCFVITNELSSLEKVEKRVRLLKELRDYYGYNVNRILLLYHDKDLEAPPNPVWETAILEFQKHYFEGRSVFTILNKPNFLSEDILQKQRFLDMFLSECITSRDPIQPSFLLFKLQDISEICHSLEPLECLIFTSREQKEYHNKAKNHYNKLEEAQVLQAQPGQDLYSAFVEFLQGLIENTTHMSHSVAVRRRMKSELDIRSKKQSLYVREIDAFHYQTEYIPTSAIPSLIKAFRKQAVASSLKYKWWTIKTDIMQGFDSLTHKVAMCSVHFPAQRDKYAVVLDAVCATSEGVRQCAVSGLVTVSDKTEDLRATLYMETQDTDRIIVVVGGLERFLFCNKLVEVIQPFTFPGFKTFTEGNQSFVVNYYGPSRMCTCCIVSLDLCSINLFRYSEELVSQAAIVYFLLDYPKKTHELAAVDAADIMLRTYKSLPMPERSHSKVVFLSNDAEKLANCRQLALHGFDADFRLVTVEEGSARVMELLYEVPGLLRFE